MILAIDIGNTTTTFGVFEGRRLASQFSIGTQPNRTPDEVTLQLKALAKTRRLHLRRATQILICSVVPRMTAVLTEALQSMDRVRVRLVGQEVKVPLLNRYRYPEQVGQDRLVGGYAAWKQFGRGQGATRRGRGQDVIVCDFGTAITLDIVTARAEYLGGIIAPGLDISLEVLATRTALLPKVELKEPPELLGRDTANSIRAGVLYGCAALCEGLIGQLRRRYAPKAVVVATGGAARLLARHTQAIDHVRPHLVLEGLALLAGQK